MIARAKKAPRIPGLGRQLSRGGLSDRRAADGREPRRADSAAFAARQALATRREDFFSRAIDFIPCAEFRRKSAEALASTPPAEASVPLDQRPSDPSALKGLTPYLASLYQNRLLTPAEEQYYFRRMNWLKYRASATRRRLDRRRATARQMDAVEGLLAEAETVKAILITGNLRLVVSIAKKFVDPTWSFDELVSEGNLALMRAVEKFNFALGNRFSTYATYAIQRHFFRLSHRGRQFRKRFVSDDAALRDRAEVVPDTAYRPAEQIGVLEDMFAGFLGDLEPRERRVVVARFGFDGRPPRTFRELGSQMGVCKERIRQIQSRALEKLRGMAAEAGLEQIVGNWL
ncbi:MAG: sigma-70 family RNA polymerase sigma factor [Planctomycetia bacterium]|jgi:RNA polymerase primary sigma factor